MAIYEFKDFLNIDDVAEYLTDKGVSKFYPLITHSEKRLNGLLSEWIKLGKLRPLYPFDKWVVQYKMDYGFEINESNVMEFSKNILDDFIRTQDGEPTKFNHKGKRIDIGEKFINDYLIFGRSIWEDLCSSEKSILGILDWHRFYNDENNKYQFDIIYCDDIPQEHREFTILRNKVVFLKSELDAIFNPTPINTETTTLQTQLDQAHARIAELEQQLQGNQSESNTPTCLPCFDEINIYTYPPELDMAIKIWKEIYQTDNIPKHFTNHSDKFTQACKNLGFAFTENAIETRLKKVTTPQSQKEKTKNKNSLK